MTFLLDHLPENAGVAITTRADPPLPVARLRNRGDLLELRAADPRFTPREAAAFLNDVTCLGLELGQVDALGSRTEGWVSGLQLAVQSLRNRDADEFIEGFTGSHRFVLDYLVEEVDVIGELRSQRWHNLEAQEDAAQVDPDDSVPFGVAEVGEWLGPRSLGGPSSTGLPCGDPPRRLSP